MASLSRFLCVLIVFSHWGFSADEKIKAIVEFQKPGSGSWFYGDLLDGVDHSKPDTPFTDPSHCIRVGIYGEQKPDGSVHSLRYSVKTLAPGKGYVKESLHMTHWGYWYGDLQKSFKKQFRNIKSMKMVLKKRQALMRLLNWCHSHFLFGEIPKVKKELDKIKKKFPFLNTPLEDPGEKHEEIVAAMKEIQGVKEATVRSSLHITLVSDFIPKLTMDRLLEIGERVIQDFKDMMCETKEEQIPDCEILRVICFRKLPSFQDGLSNYSALSYGRDFSEGEQANVLVLGSVYMNQHFMDYTHVTNMCCFEKRSETNRNLTRPNVIDFKDLVVHFLGHSLTMNRFEPIMEETQHLMPWLMEGMSIHLSIKHLNTKNFACVGLPVEKAGGSRTRQKKGRKGADFDVGKNNLEHLLNKAALKPEADDFMTMIQRPELYKLKPETLAKAFSMITFLLETDRTGFIKLMDGLQDHSLNLFERGGLKVFFEGMDRVVADSLQDLDSVDALEKKWREWAENRVKGRK